MSGTRLQTEQKRKGPAPLQGHDCCPALRSNAATSTNFVIVVHRNLQFCTPGDVARILSCATPTQHACCVTTQRCMSQYSVPAGCKKVELCLEGWLSRKCVGEGAKYRKLQRCAAAQHAMLRGCCVHVAYDETHATL